MDSFPGADGKMVLAMGANLQILVEFLVEDHSAAFGALGPKAFQDLPLFGFGAGEFGLFSKSGIPRNRGWGGNGRLGCFETEGLLCESIGRHSHQTGFGLRELGAEGTPNRWGFEFTAEFISNVAA